MNKRKQNFESGNFSKVRIHEADSTTGNEIMATGGGGGGGTMGVGSDGEKTKQPIYDSLRENQLCFNFTERTWEEITTKPSMTGFQFSYNRFFTDDVKKVLGHYFHCTQSTTDSPLDSFAMPFRGFKIIPGKITLSNFIVLSDNIQVGAGGVNEVSSFVQKSKICVFHKPKSELPYSYFTETENGDASFLTFGKEHLSSEIKKSTVNNLIETSIEDYDSIENLRYLPHGHRVRKNLFNAARPNSISDLNNQIFPNYVGCSIYEDMYDTNKSGVQNIASVIVSRKAGLFGKYSATNSNLAKYYNIANTNRKNYIRENMNFDIIDGGEVINFQNLPTTDVINLTPSTISNIYTETPYAQSFASFQDGIRGTAYYTGVHQGCDQAYINESVTTSIVDRIMKIKNKGLGHEFICMIPIRKSDNTIMKLRANCMFETSFQICLYSRRDKEWLDQGQYVETPEGDALKPDMPEYSDARLHSQVENTKRLKQKVGLPYFVLQEEEDMCVFP
uniref:Nonstructural protein n=1 Tax=Phylloscopus inornatus densovirus TaxID=2794547 RepID=A0A8A4XDJ0_9VIRU|nr:MAG: nonstructural protein [Phylloscopus inornatus densovirus]